jgi:septal ring factor EnvC (AmiA/AmiB activator)
MAEKKNADKLHSLRKPLRALSLGIALVGLFVLLVFTVIINDAVDKIRDSILSNLETTRQAMIDLEEALGTLEEGLDSAEEAVDSLEGSIGPLSDGLEAAGDALDSTGSSLSLLSLVGVDVGSMQQDFSEASTSLKQSATELEGTAITFTEQKSTLSGLKEDLGDIKGGVRMQREAIGQTKKDVEDVFGLVKLANIMFFLVVASMFTILILNSVAGLV